MEAVALVLGAGAGERLGIAEPKAFLEIGGRTLLEHAASAAAACASVSALVVAVPPGNETRAQALLSELGKPVVAVAGGPSRRGSARLALAAVPASTEAVVCHDAARPLATPHLFDAVLAALDDADGAVPVVPVADTLKRVRDGEVAATVPREGLWLAQTPQAFRAPAFRDAHERAPDDEAATDDAVLLERAGYRVAAVPGEVENLKITTPEDLVRAEVLLTASRR